MPLVSVIMSVYNGQRYLEESIDSVLKQQFGDFEFLIYDDGSTDNTSGIVESKKDARIKFFRAGSNQGLFPVLNKLIAQSKGKYIRLWSYDDIMKPPCLAAMVEFYEQHPEIGFCYCARDSIDASGKITPCERDEKTPTVISPEIATQIMLYFGCIAGNISTAMIKKATLDEMQGFRDQLSQSADFDMWVRVSEKYPIGFIREPLIFLRSHPAQFSRWNKAVVDTMKGNYPIYETLLKRMPPELTSYARKYLNRRLYVQYFHYMISNLAKGQFSNACAILGELRKHKNIFSLFWLWLTTFGGRAFMPRPKFKD